MSLIYNVVEVIIVLQSNHSKGSSSINSFVEVVIVDRENIVLCARSTIAFANLFMIKRKITRKTYLYLYLRMLEHENIKTGQTFLVNLINKQ